MRPPENEESTINTKRMSKTLQLVWILSVACLCQTQQGVKTYCGKEPCNVAIRWVLGGNESQQEACVWLAWRNDRIFPTLPKDKNALILLASAVNLEKTNPKDCQFILGEMGINPKNS